MQLISWASGKSIHGPDGVCCYDFSCCKLHPMSVLTPKAVRVRLLKAVVEDDCVSFLNIISMIHTKMKVKIGADPFMIYGIAKFAPKTLN